MINIEAPNWQNSEVLTLNLANNFFYIYSWSWKAYFTCMLEYESLCIWPSRRWCCCYCYSHSEIESGSTLKIFFLNMSAPRDWNNSKMSYFKRLVSKKVKAKNRDQLTPKISFTWYQVCYRHPLHHHIVRNHELEWGGGVVVVVVQNAADASRYNQKKQCLLNTLWLRYSNFDKLKRLP